MIEVLKRELVNEPRLAETVHDLDVMRRSLLETVGTMDRFLDAERFRKGKVQLKAGPVVIRDLLEEAVAHFSYQAKEKGIELRLDIQSECAMTSDRELLALIFQNLLSNAVKYTERGQVLITSKPAKKGGYLISVADQGPGIAPEQMAKLFDSFTRGDTHGQPGVGLGLSIAQQASVIIGAKLWAESTPGEGSTFHLQVPANVPVKN
jgi:signal transduction histidine kinase